MLKSLTVQHYKSLAEIRVDFTPVTILVGPNGSGKSNIVDVLRFVRDAVVYGLDHALSERGGLDIVRQYSPTRPYSISIKLEFETDDGISGNQFPASYTLKIAGSGSNYRVESEDASWSQTVFVVDDEEDEAENDRDSGSVFSEVHSIESFTLHRDRHGKVFVNDQERKRPVAPDQLAIKTFGPPTEFFEHHGTISRQLSGLRFASMYPNILREPSRPDTDRQLKENCANWASILKAMRQRKLGEQMIHRITELMRQVMPGLETVSVKLVGGYLVPQFLIKDNPDSKAHYFDPVQLSDGTLRLFAIFLTLYQTPHPVFLALEEPELTIHPGLISLLAEATREVSERTQLLITTHSPYVLDHFAPEEIKVVSMREGETRVSGIRRSQVETVKKGLMTLSEVMVLDGLRPE